MAAAAAAVVVVVALMPPFVIDDVFLSNFVLRPKFSMFNFSVSTVVVVVVALVVLVALTDSLSSVEPDFVLDTGAAVVASFLLLFMSSICLEAEAPVVGRGPVMGARPDGVSANTVK